MHFNEYMNFVVYCHIFPRICILYNVISMFNIVFGDFPMTLLILVITIQNKKSSFVYFYFKDLYEFKWT
jgi:hypothetical protein